MTGSNGAWFDDLYEAAEARPLSRELLQHLSENRERIVATIQLLEKHQLRRKRICEIGPGGVGAACRHYLEAEVDGYDCNDWSGAMCTHFGVNWKFADLHASSVRLDGPYDAVLLCEVIEHLARWPEQVFNDLRAALKPGGLLVVTTPNLHRLSQRIRMLAGQRLFAHYVPEELRMAHLREYTPEEIVYLLNRAGFQHVETKLKAFPDLRSPVYIQSAYRLLCGMSPRLSNVFFCWTTK